MKICVLGVLVCLALPAAALAQSDSLGGVVAATPQYDLSIHILPDAHRMEVEGTLRIPPVEKPQATVELILSELMKNFHADIVEPKENAGPVEANKQKKKDVQEQFVRWALHPKRPIAANRTLQIRFSYVGGEGTAFVFYIGPEGSFAGGADTAWYPQFEDNGGKGRGRLAFSVPAGLTVVATGKRVSAAAEEEKGNFAFENALPSQFSFSVGNYAVLKREGLVPMRAYVLHDRANVQGYLEGSSKVLEALSKEFGPYPYDEFAIAEVPSEQAGKAGFSGASMNGFMLADKEALDDPFNLAYYGHEIGHQWWGNVVTLAGDRGAFMLDEAMAQYGSLRVVETMEGTVAAEEYRRSGYPGYNPQQCGYGYLLVTDSGQDHALADLPKGPGHALADSKGFLVWEMLSNTIGPERFGQVLRNITEKYRFRSIRWEEFLAAVQSASAEDLGWFYSQWLERTGAPDWQVTWKQEGSIVRGAITQAEPLYRAQLEVELQGTNGETMTHTAEVKNSRAEFAWPVNFRVRSVILDPHFRVLHWLPDLRAKVLARAPYMQSAALRDSGKLDEAEALLQKALQSATKPDEHAAIFYDKYGLARISMEKKAWQQAETFLDAALAAPSRDAEFLPFVYYRYAQVAQALHDDAKLHWAVEAAVGADALIPGGTGAAELARDLLAAKTAN